jgi:Flp pilus assembly protein TadG
MMRSEILRRWLLGKTGPEVAGSVLVEAAVVFPIFFLLIFSAIEFGMILYVTALVDDAVTEGSRYGITGSSYVSLQPQLASCLKGQTSRAAFLLCFVKQRADLICSRGDCVTVTAAPYDGWPANATGATKGFNAGSGGQVVKYTVNYTWHTISPLLMPFLGKQCIISATAIVQDEAF